MDPESSLSSYRRGHKSRNKQAGAAGNGSRARLSSLRRVAKRGHTRWPRATDSQSGCHLNGWAQPGAQPGATGNGYSPADRLPAEKI